MNTIIFYSAKRAFSDALEGVASKSFDSMPMNYYGKYFLSTEADV